MNENIKQKLQVTEIKDCMVVLKRIESSNYGLQKKKSSYILDDSLESIVSNQTEDLQSSIES